MDLKKTFSILTLAVLTASAVSCARNSQGGQDGGGGQAQMSTPEDVSRAIDYAYKLATDNDPLFNIFYRYFSDNEGPIRLADNPEDLHFRLQKYLFPQSKLNKLNAEDLRNSQVIIALRAHAPFKKASGDCAQPDSKHADAAVSNHTPAAQICFSLGNLARLPRSVLVTEVLSLLMHEASHMGGAREQDAKTVQKLFADYVLTHFGELRIPKEYKPGTLHLNDLLDSSTLALGEAIMIENGNPGDPKTWEKFSLFLSALYAEHSHFDPLKLEFDYPTTDHEKSYAYLNSIMALIEKAQNATGFTEMVYANEMKIIPSPIFKGGQLLDLLMDLNENLQVVNINFLALVGSDYDPICALPDKQIDPSTFSPRAFHESKGILLPRRCKGANVQDGEKYPFPSHEEFKKLLHSKTQTNPH